MTFIFVGKLTINFPFNITFELNLCTLTEYPASCSKFLGRHSIECLNEMWKKEGCLEEGNHYPGSVPRIEASKQQSYSLGFVVCYDRVWIYDKNILVSFPACFHFAKSLQIKGMLDNK